MPDPALVQAVKDLGSLGFALLAVWGFLTGRVRVGKLVDDDKAGVVKERDEWKARSLATDARLDRIATVFEKVTKSTAPE